MWEKRSSLHEHLPFAVFRRRIVGGIMRTYWRLFICSLILLPFVSAGSECLAQNRPNPFFILIDVSGSMGETPRGWDTTKIAAVRKNLTEFVGRLPDQTEVTFFPFSKTILEERHFALPQDRDAVTRYVAGITEQKAWTYAWRSLDRVLAIAAQTVEKSPGTTANVFIFSDGEDNDPSGPTQEGVLKRYSDLLLSKGEDKRINAWHISLGFSLSPETVKTDQDYGVLVVPSTSGVDIMPPVANFDWVPRQPTVSDEVTFRDASSGRIRSYRWDFGDGEQSDLKAPRAKIFKRAGTFTVTLTVTGENSMSASTPYRLTVVPETVTEPGFDVKDREGVVGKPVGFQNRSQGPVARFRWDFGDGSASGDENPYHAYDRAGKFDVALVVTDQKGNEKRAEKREAVDIRPGQPKAEFRGPEKAGLGEDVSFYDVSSGQIDRREWSFGDGTPVAADTNPTHRFAKPGRFTVVLACEGPGGKESVSHDVEVVPPSPPVARFIAGDPKPKVRTPVRFADISRGSVDRVTWGFGDGSPAVEVSYRAEGGETERYVEHTFANPGEITVTLDVIGPGGTDRTEQRIRLGVNPVAAKAMFQAKPTSGRGTLDVLFHNTSEGIAKEYVWDFGDGSQLLRTGSNEDVRHTFQPGQHTVTLKAVPVDGSAASVYTEQIAVAKPYPKWLIHLVWIVPVAGLALAGIRLWRRRYADGVRMNWLRTLTGEIRYRVKDVEMWSKVPILNRPKDSFKFSLEEPEKPVSGFSPDAGSQHSRVRGPLVGTLTVSVDPDNKSRTFTLSLLSTDTEQQPLEFGPCEVNPDGINETPEMAGYVFQYSP